MWKPRTCEEITIYTIEMSSKKLEKGLMTFKQANLNKWFAKLKVQNVGMWEEMYPKYIELARKLHKLK